MSVEEYIKLIKQYEHYEYHDPNAERLPGDDRGTPEPYYHQYDPEQSEVEIDVEDNLCRAKEIGTYCTNVSLMNDVSEST